MAYPAISRAASPDQIRREIDVLEKEIAGTREKRNRISRAIAEKQVKIDRLKSELLALTMSSGAARPAEICIG